MVKRPLELVSRADCAEREEPAILALFGLRVGPRKTEAHR